MKNFFLRREPAVTQPAGGRGKGREEDGGVESLDDLFARSGKNQKGLAIYTRKKKRTDVPLARREKGKTKVIVGGGGGRVLKRREGGDGVCRLHSSEVKHAPRIPLLEKERGGIKRTISRSQSR